MNVIPLLPLVLLACTSQVMSPGVATPDAATPDAAPPDVVVLAEEVPEYLEVVILAPDELQAGTTLLGIGAFDDARPSGYASIVEVAADGEVLWRYDLPEELDEFGSVFDVEPTADGTILFVVLGRGVYEVNRGGEMVWWHEDAYASHDVDRLANGNTLYTRGLAPEGEALVVEITPAEETVWSWDGLDDFASEPFAGFADEMDAWAHPNAVTRRADGSTDVCLRNFNTVVNVSASGALNSEVTFTAGAGMRSIATQGVTGGARPHDATMLDDRTLLVALRDPHQVVEIDTIAGTTGWSWHLAEDADEPDAAFRDADRLPNGNTLVTGARRVYEIAPDGEVLWELVPPRHPLEDSDRELAQRVKRVFNATRILPDGSAIVD